MAATEYERAYQNQDSKQILFARDLAPSYDFTTTAGKLDATAYGDGNVSYQWYKDGEAIADATTATYTPTESGKYYCKATANGNTITTSATNVTTKSANTDGEQTPSTGSKKAEFDINAFGGFGSSGNKVDYSVTITANNVTITAIKDVVAYGSSKGCRVNGTGSFKVTAPKNAKITKIICTTDKSSIQLTPNVTSDKTGIISKDITFDYSKA